MTFFRLFEQVCHLIRKGTRRLTPLLTDCFNFYQVINSLFYSFLNCKEGQGLRSLSVTHPRVLCVGTNGVSPLFQLLSFGCPRSLHQALLEASLSAQPKGWSPAQGQTGATVSRLLLGVNPLSQCCLINFPVMKDMFYVGHVQYYRH